MKVKSVYAQGFAAKPLFSAAVAPVKPADWMAWDATSTLTVAEV